MSAGTIIIPTKIEQRGNYKYVFSEDYVCIFNQTTDTELLNELLKHMEEKSLICIDKGESIPTPTGENVKDMVTTYPNIFRQGVPSKDGHNGLLTTNYVIANYTKYQGNGILEFNFGDQKITFEVYYKFGPGLLISTEDFKSSEWNNGAKTSRLGHYNFITNHFTPPPGSETPAGGKRNKRSNRRSKKSKQSRRRRTRSRR